MRCAGSAAMVELGNLFSPDGFMPHGMCYLWRPGILALHVASDSLITLAYFSIPFTLIYFVRRRSDLRFGWVFVSFAVFIIACGASHLMEIWTVWHPDYWLSGGVKAVTALASVPTAILLVKLVPAALRMPSPAALESANAELAREVAERRAAEEQVRKLNESLEGRMAALVESADDAIIIKDLDGMIRSWNAGANRLLEYRADEIIGKHITQLLPDDRKEEEALFLSKIRRGEPLSHFETVRRRRNGSLVDVSLTISPIRDRTGAIVGASKIMRDITERKRYVEQLRSLNDELEQRILARNAELRERDALLQEIHHRVKNNLQVISSLLSMQVRTLRDGATRAALQQCRSRVETMAQIHEMLYQSKDYSSVPFARYAQELASRVLSASGLSPEEVTIHFDMQDIALAVEQAIPCALILNELISNALKHAFPHGAGAMRIELRRLAENRVVLCVSDDGVGIPPDIDLARSGSLGMQLIVTLAEQLDGSLEIERAPGAAFRITFPYGVSDDRSHTA